MKTEHEKQMWSPDSPRAYTRWRIERACAGNQPTLLAFADWLEEVRGLAPRTVETWLHPTCTFLDAVTACAEASCTQTLKSLGPDSVEDFFIQYGEDHGMASRRNMRSAMRLFLTFAASKGWSDQELADAVPKLSSYRLSSLPRGLKDEELQTLLSSPWEGGSPLRDRAIVYALATYGARREQMSSLQLADIDWHERTIVFAAHKGGKAIHHDLTEAVAECLADYLRHERPASDCDYVFLRQMRPYVQLSPGAITELVKARAVRCGLLCSPHCLRHAFATRLLRAGESVKAIADLLGHRSLAAVSIYAKVDYVRLLEVAGEWPEVES